MSISPASETTHIAKTTVIKGEVRLEGPGTIAGRVDGGIIGKDVDIQADAHVEGDISCTMIELNGNVKGNVTASKSCKLGATARVSGEIRTANLGIAEGATFVGQVFVGTTAKTETATSAEATPANRSESTTSTEDAADGVNVLSGNVQNSLNRNAPKVAPRPYASGAR